MSQAGVLVFSPQSARGCRESLGRGNLALRVAPPPLVAPPPDTAGWHRAVSELALFNWLLVPSAAAAEALLEAGGAPPGPTLRLAALSPAAEVFRREGREPQVEADGLRALLTALAGALGRRQRVFVPHAAAAGRRLTGWLEALGAEPVLTAAYDLRVPESFAPPVGTAAVLCEPADAESMAAWVRAGIVPAAMPVAAFGAPAIDAAEDCGLSVTAFLDEAPDRALERHLGPFLDEALS